MSSGGQFLVSPDTAEWPYGWGYDGSMNSTSSDSLRLAP